MVTGDPSHSDAVAATAGASNLYASVLAPGPGALFTYLTIRGAAGAVGCPVATTAGRPTDMDLIHHSRSPPG
ncbi:hypothetical protein GCM10019017_76750 [Streptomyces showdoensis]